MATKKANTVFHTVAYKTGYIQYSTINGVERIYAQYRVNGVFDSFKANSTAHAKLLITRGTK